MKIRLTKKQINEMTEGRAICVGYGSLDVVFSKLGIYPIACYANKLGWRFDLYRVGEHWVSTGYEWYGRYDARINQRLSDLDERARDGLPSDRLWDRLDWILESAEADMV